MSGIPQELVQRLAQELLRQVRLEVALDPPPAITLTMEEAAAAWQEAGLTAPATAEQVTPEKIPRLIQPFLQRLAQPTRKTAGGPEEALMKKREGEHRYASAAPSAG